MIEKISFSLIVFLVCFCATIQEKRLHPALDLSTVIQVCADENLGMYYCSDILLELEIL